MLNLPPLSPTAKYDGPLDRPRVKNLKPPTSIVNWTEKFGKPARGPDWDSLMKVSSLVLPNISKWNAMIDRSRELQRRNKRQARDLTPATNTSRVVDALLKLGMAALDKEEAARRGSERSQEGNAGPVEVKRARRDRRAQAIA